MKDYLVSVPKRIVRTISGIVFILLNLILNIPLHFLYHEEFLEYMGRQYAEYVNSIGKYEGKKWAWSKDKE